MQATRGVVIFYSAGVVTHNRRLDTGANPTIVSYNASVVEAYNATSSLVRFENKNNFTYIH
jgi:hypothetical protein